MRKHFQRRILRNFSDYPIRTYMAADVPISINTDNRTVSGTTCTKEFERVLEQFPITEEELEQIYIQSVEMSFATDDCKHLLLQKWKK